MWRKVVKIGCTSGKAVTGAQTQKVVPDKQTQGRPQENASESMPERGHLANLPKIDGITYQTVTAQDGRSCIVATGNTQAKKELLMGAGFKWNAQRKTWWRYEVSQHPGKRTLNRDRLRPGADGFAGRRARC